MRAVDLRSARVDSRTPHTTESTRSTSATIAVDRERFHHR